MSRHEGVSCDSCLKSNFKGKRYKCLICYDYDLCSTCYEEGCVTARHITEHPMQCILTRNDYELYYGGDTVSAETTQSYTCPYCGKMGFTEILLIEHVNSQHSQSPFDVICPICAAGNVSRPNVNVSREDLVGHLNLQHRNPPRELMSIFDEPHSRHAVRRIPLPATRSMPSRGRRSNVHFGSAGAIAAINPARDAADPIAEFLTHLSVVRRSQTSSPVTAERQHIRASRHTDKVAKKSPGTAPAPSNPDQPKTDVQAAPITQQISISQHPSQLMLPKILKETPAEHALEALDEERLGRSLYIKQLLMSSLSKMKVVG